MRKKWSPHTICEAWRLFRRYFKSALVLFANNLKSFADPLDRDEKAERRKVALRKVRGPKIDSLRVLIKVLALRLEFAWYKCSTTSVRSPHQFQTLKVTRRNNCNEQDTLTYYCEPPWAAHKGTLPPKTSHLGVTGCNCPPRCHSHWYLNAAPLPPKMLSKTLA